MNCFSCSALSVDVDCSWMADGWRAVVWLLKADQDMKRDSLKLPNINLNEDFCANCRADSGAIPWYDFRPGALWRSTCYKVRTWETSGWNTCKLFRTPGISCHSTDRGPLKIMRSPGPSSAPCVWGPRAQGHPGPRAPCVFQAFLICMGALQL